MEIHPSAREIQVWSPGTGVQEQIADVTYIRIHYGHWYAIGEYLHQFVVHSRPNIIYETDVRISLNTRRRKDTTFVFDNIVFMTNF